MNPGRKVLVLGATGRLGGGVARALARRGDRVVLTARDRGKLEALAAEVGPSPGAAAPYVRADLVDETAPDAIVDGIRRSVGRVDDIVIACGPSPRAPFESLRREDLRQAAAWRRSSTSCCLSSTPPGRRAKSGASAAERAARHSRREAAYPEPLRSSCCFAALATAPETFLLLARPLSSLSRKWMMSRDANANGVRGLLTRFTLTWCERVHSRSRAMARSTSSETVRLALIRTTSFSWMLGLLIAACATSRFESRTSSSRSAALPSIARRIFCEMVILASCA